MSNSHDDHKNTAIESRPVTPDTVFEDKALRELYAYWSKVAGDDAIPQKSNFELIDLLDVSSEILILDLVSPGLDFRFRLVGTDIIDRLGVDPTGDLISSYPLNAFWMSAIEICRRVVLERRPYWRPPLSSSYPDKSFLTVQAVVLPLLNDTGDVTRIVGLMHYGD